MLNDTKTRTVRKRTISYVYIEEPIAPVRNVSVDMREQPDGTYRLEANGMNRQKAVAAAKYILGIH